MIQQGRLSHPVNDQSFGSEMRYCMNEGDGFRLEGR